MPAPDLMSLNIDFEGLWDVRMKARVYSTLRACIGDPPGGQDWNVLVASFGGFCGSGKGEPADSPEGISFTGFGIVGGYSGLAETVSFALTGSGAVGCFAYMILAPPGPDHQ